MDESSVAEDILLARSLGIVGVALILEEFAKWTPWVIAARSKRRLSGKGSNVAFSKLTNSERANIIVFRRLIKALPVFGDEAARVDF